MRSSIAFILLAMCIALVQCGCLPRKYPYTRDQCYLNTYDQYPLKRLDPVNYYLHNYNKAENHHGVPYFGYPYGECSSCRLYQTEEVGAVHPECPCNKLAVEY